MPWEDWREGDDEQHLGVDARHRARRRPGLQDKALWSGELGYGVRAPEGGQPGEAAAKAAAADAHDHDDHDAHGGDHH